MAKLGAVGLIIAMTVYLARMDEIDEKLKSLVEKMEK